MSTIALDTTTPVPGTSITQSLRTLYATRAGFAFVWAALLFTTRSPTFAGALLVSYPAWDAALTALDLRRGAPQGRALQWTNFAFSAATAVAIGLASGVVQTITVFAAWAIVAGLLQLGVGLSRRRQLGGQWAMILSGGQSALAGLSFLAMAHTPDASVQKLAPYAVFGGLYFAVSAFRLGRAARTAK